MTKAELAKIYKKGFGTDVEVYQIIKDISKDMGIPCVIVRDIRVDTSLSKPTDYKKYVLLDLKNNKVLHLKASKISAFQLFFMGAAPKSCDVATDCDRGINGSAKL